MTSATAHILTPSSPFAFFPFPNPFRIFASSFFILMGLLEGAGGLEVSNAMHASII